MRRSPGKWLLTFWIILLGGLFSACQPVPTVLPSETTPTPGRTLPPPAQTRTVRSAPTLTPTPIPSPTPTQAPSLLPIEPSALRGLTVPFWHTATGEAETLLQSLAAEFNQSNPWGITVQPVSHAGLGVLDEQVRLARSEKRLSGLIAAYTDQALLWDADDSGLADLTPYLTDPVWGLSPADQQDFYATFWAHDLVRRSNGTGKLITKRLGVPWYRSAMVLYYNRTWAQELGFRTLPDTPVEFRRQVCRAAQAHQSAEAASDDPAGGWLITADPLLFLGWVHAFGGDIQNENRSALTFHTPAAEAAVQYMASLIADGCAWSTEEETAPEAFATRRTLAWIGSLANLSLQERALQQAASEDQWVVLPFPSEDGTQTIETYGPDLVVAKSKPAQELAAWLFARWLLSAEHQASWAEANGVFPVRAAALQQPRLSSGQAPQWEQALVWLPKARSEPAQAFWGRMRGVLQDALEQVLLPGFQSSQAASLLIKLDQFAVELESQVR